MFYIGYMVSQPAWTYCLGRFPAGKVLGISCVLWGVSVLTMIANKSFTDIMVNRCVRPRHLPPRHVSDLSNPLRFFLGFLEGPVTPGLSLAVRPALCSILPSFAHQRSCLPQTGFWWTRSEAPLRQTIWYSAVGWGGMIGSLMAAGIQGLSDDGPVKRWQLIFVILGAITVAWGGVLYFFLADGPSNAPWLNKEMRPLAVARVAANGTG